jgi:subtilisin family serine protease
MKSISAILLLAFLVTSSFAPAPQTAWQAKVDAWLLARASQTAIDGSSPVEFLVFLSEQADLSGAAALPTKQEKGAYVFRRLTETAHRSQPALIRDLAARGVAYRSFWVANMLWVRGDLSLIQALAQRADVAHIYANPQVKMQLPQAQASRLAQTPQNVQWNLTWVKADQVWAAGYTGQGTVIGGADTGYEWQHPALKPHYRGWDGMAADHDFNWHDAIHTGTGTCGADSPQPCDVYGHGTHTMGIMVGDDGGTSQIGMAPGAKWIGCRNMDNAGNGTPARYSECFEWFIAPYAIGADPMSGDPARAPDVINNSWGCTYGEGCTNPNDLLAVISNVRAAGILVVGSAGNSGSACSTVNEPPAIYDPVFTVGATGYQTDGIAGFSSRGPVTVDGSNRLKPDISAPGASIYSSIPGASPGNPAYGIMSGTSMAAPHVAGLAALLISAEPGLRGRVDLLESVIEQSANHLTTLEPCGGTEGLIPNNVFGWGRINALTAYEATRHHLAINQSSGVNHIAPGGIVSYTLAVSHTHILSPTYSVILTDVIPVNSAIITATLPFSYDSGVVTWDFASLGTNQTRVVSLTLQAAITATVSLVNHAYVSSQEVPLVAAAPVTTTVGMGFYLPLVEKSP